MMFQKRGQLFIYILAPLLSFAAFWSYWQAEQHRKNAYTLIGQLTEIQWRASQAREKTAFALNAVRFIEATGNNNELPTIRKNLGYLTVNLNDLLSLEYASTLLSKADYAQLKETLAEVKSLSSQEIATTNYAPILDGMNKVWSHLVPISSNTVNLAHIIQRQTELDTEGLYIQTLILACLS